MVSIGRGISGNPSCLFETRQTASLLRDLLFLAGVVNADQFVLVCGRTGNAFHYLPIFQVVEVVGANRSHIGTSFA